MTERAGASHADATPPARAPGLGGEPEIVVRPGPPDVSTTAAERIVAALAVAVEARGRADFVTTGGSTPIGIYAVLASSLRDAVDWTRVQFWWGDDRYVPRDHPLSNVQAADAILFGSARSAGPSDSQTRGLDAQAPEAAGLAVPFVNVHPFPCGRAIAQTLGAAWCAREYVEDLHSSRLRESRGFPVFDVVLLGIGLDGHLLSVFPNSEAFDRTEWAMAIPAPTHVEPHVERVTMNPAVLGVARTVLMVTSGARKAAIVGQVFRTERDVRKLPAQLVRRSGATWILDRDVAANVPAALIRG